MNTALFIIYTLIVILIGVALGLVTGFSLALSKQLDIEINKIKEE